jgi:hypothetical protein
LDTKKKNSELAILVVPNSIINLPREPLAKALRTRERSMRPRKTPTMRPPAIAN